MGISPRRIAIIELNGVHEEIVPSLIHAIGPEAEIDVFINARCREKRGDIFAESPSFQANVQYWPIEKRADWGALAQAIDAGDYDLLVFSTMQTDSFAAFARDRGKPFVGLVHNLRMFQLSEICQDCLQSGLLTPVTLAPHVATALHIAHEGRFIDTVGVVEPVIWQDTPAHASTTDRRRIVVPGGVHFQNRAFEALIDVLTAGLATELDRAGLTLQVVGGGADRGKLETLVSDQKLADVLDLAKPAPTGMVTYDVYCAALRSAWALYPLLPAHSLPYRHFKITSSIPTALGFGLPFVLDRWTHQVYRSPAIVAGASIKEQLYAFLELDDVAHAAQQAEIAAYADAAKRRNQGEFARILDRLIP